MQQQKKNDIIKMWAIDLNLIKEDMQMINKHMKRCFTQYAVREMQSKPIMRYHRKPIGTTKLPNAVNTKGW